MPVESVAQYIETHPTWEKELPLLQREYADYITKAKREATK
ncbi:hypothetical protein [Salegentibacter salegens]|uniref:Uncharacterized protein n=1 Tax=Salegentibacter salegens TaxID=143223 RepID=A0A1M7KLZ6_9FLAO|nr:hypothetical protein [Salegentibacter salegens]PRX48892.1 hypothetical protein LY58_01184 [Salegentibacter salegens]SHM66474.1 hypothetical protein SAMN05878281_1507 [Salegentibacter salegens]